MKFIVSEFLQFQGKSNKVQQTPKTVPIQQRLGLPKQKVSYIVLKFIL